jgi:hypothetical protein
MMIPRYEGYSFDNDGLLRYNERIYVPPNDELRNLIFERSSSSSVHDSFGSHEDECRT